MRATLWIGTNDGDLQFNFDEKSKWERVNAQLARVVRDGSNGFLTIDEEQGTYNVLVNQSTHLRWRITN